MEKANSKVLMLLASFGLMAVLVVMTGFLVSAMGTSPSSQQVETPVATYYQPATVITSEQATLIAEAEVGALAKEVELRALNGVNVYEIEFDTSDAEVEVLVRESDGAIVRVLREEHIEAPSGTLSEQDAIDIARQEVTGGSVQEIEVDVEGDRFVYEIEIVDGSQEIEVIVDIETGQILGLEYEDEDEDEAEDDD